MEGKEGGVEQVSIYEQEEDRYGMKSLTMGVGMVIYQAVQNCPSSLGALATSIGKLRTFQFFLIAHQEVVLPVM